jgi:hypothetical protein
MSFDTAMEIGLGVIAFLFVTLIAWEDWRWHRNVARLRREWEQGIDRRHQ